MVLLTSGKERCDLFSRKGEVKENAYCVVGTVRNNSKKTLGWEVWLKS
jgi:hypothetical protein